MSGARVQRIVFPVDAQEPAVGRWLWCLEDARARTLERLDGMDGALVDWSAPEGGNSTGIILYHIAAIEADYLYIDVLEQPFPHEIIDLFPYDVREENGRLTPVRGHALPWYLHRLSETRNRLLAIYRAMDLADFQRVRSHRDGRHEVDITPEWTLHHLMQHEAEHRGELASVRARVESDRRS